jgi:exonuclease VII large subunit
MCMGGGSAATITVPDYAQYDQQFDLQKAAIEQAASQSTLTAQADLNTALRAKQDAQTQLLVAKQQQADDTNAAAMRLAQVVGPPPREKHAKPPEIGVDERGLKTKKGKSSLRIGKVATSSASGSGLNIT